MTIIYHREYCAILEAHSIMTRYYTHEDFDKLKNNLQEKSGYTQYSEYVLTTVKQMYEEVVKDFEFPQELEVYFRNIDKNSGNNLAMAMLMDSWLVEEIEDADIAAYLKQRFHKEQAMFISCVIDDFVFEKQFDDKGFMEELETMDIDEGMKWNIWRVYQNFDEHLDRLLDVVLKPMHKIRKVYADYEHAFDDFHAYWEAACQDGSVYEKLKRSVKVSGDFEQNEIMFYPKYIYCNSLQFTTNDRTMKHLYLYLGLLFREDSFVNDTKLSRSEMLVRFKLLSDASKYEILQLLKNERKYGLELAEHLHLSAATISHHMNALSSCGLLNMEKDANRVYYRLNKVQIECVIDQLRKDLLE